ncbi:MAG TPA: helix-turn-helix domain-containing protein [Rhodocyclaceae bacterium]|nr:helix-turn-helix domain-containing protein [Rhodocyclaceae bacterium]
MDVKIDPKILRQCRDARAWSQERLAEAAGLSVRTVQRVEADGRASAETRQALAGALGMEVARLSPPQDARAEPYVPTVVSPVPAAFATAGERHRCGRRGRFSRHLGIYVAMSLLFIVLDVQRDGRLDWAWWPILGWGIGVMNHFFATRRHSAKGA